MGSKAPLTIRLEMPSAVNKFIHQKCRRAAVEADLDVLVISVGGCKGVALCVWLGWICECVCVLCVEVEWVCLSSPFGCAFL